jgi:hypothetical protein
VLKWLILYAKLYAYYSMGFSLNLVREDLHIQMKNMIKLNKITFIPDTPYGKMYMLWYMSDSDFLWFSLNLIPGPLLGTIIWYLLGYSKFTSYSVDFGDKLPNTIIIQIMNGIKLMSACGSLFAQISVVVQLW